MTEDQKIEEFLSKYIDFFKKTDVDVTHSVKGVWYYYRYDENRRDFSSFVRFETLEQLKAIIVSELADDFNFVVELIGDTISFDYRLEQVQDVTERYDYQNNINRLNRNLESMNKNIHYIVELVQKLNAVVSCSELSNKTGLNG